MDKAQGATQGFLPQNLCGTHTSSAESSGRRYVAAALLGDGHAACHLATSAEAADRGLVMRSSDWYCPPDVSITEAPVRGGVGNPPGLTVSVDPGHRAVWVSPDPGPTPGQPEAW
jgi:hypothetical protein